MDYTCVDSISSKADKSLWASPTTSYVDHAPERHPAATIIEDDVLMIPSEFRITYTTTNMFRQAVRRAFRECNKTNITVRLGFQGCFIDTIDNELGKMKLGKHLRLWYDRNVESVIIKLMPSGAHDVTCGEFSRYITVKIAALPGQSMDSVVSMNTTRFEYGGRGKEADFALRCRTRAAGEWPNIVIEIGYAETLAHLRLDAKWWLNANSEKTKMVLLVRVGRAPDFLHIEQWKMVPNNNPGPVTRSQPLIIPRCISTFDIDAACIVTPVNTPLVIPFNDIYDVPNPNANNVVLLPSELSNIASCVFTAT
jgi:hypothetical protein